MSLDSILMLRHDLPSELGRGFKARDGGPALEEPKRMQREESDQDTLGPRKQEALWVSGEVRGRG